MGLRGPAPTPTKILEARGSKLAGKRAGKEPMPQRARPKRPSWLVSKHGRAKWAELVPLLDKLGVLTTIDGGTLAAACAVWNELVVATQTLDEKGRTFTTENGYPVQRPEVAQQRSALAAWKSYSALFGLDPSSRARITVSPPDVDDPLEDYLTGKGRFFRPIMSRDRGDDDDEKKPA